MSCRMSKNLRLPITCFITTCLAPLSSWADQSAPSSTSELEQITVTATKRAETLQEVPSSLSAISATALETQGITGFSDYMGLVPGLSDFSGGAEGHGMVILRGL